MANRKTRLNIKTATGYDVSYPETTGDQVLMQGYARPAAAEAITPGDTAMSAIGKLEKNLERSGQGDMNKVVYDKKNKGYVDKAELAGNAERLGEKKATEYALREAYDGKEYQGKHITVTVPTETTAKLEWIGGNAEQGKSVQNSPSPEHPSEIKGVGDGGSVDIRACGRNLWDMADMARSFNAIRANTFVTETVDNVECWQLNKPGTEAMAYQYFMGFKPDIRYRIKARGKYKTLVANHGSYIEVVYTDGTKQPLRSPAINTMDWWDADLLTIVGKSVSHLGVTYWDASNTYYAKNSMQITEGVEDYPATPCVVQDANIPVDAPLYALHDADGDMVVQDYMDCIGREVVRECWRVEVDGTKGAIINLTAPIGYTSFATKYTETAPYTSKTYGLFTCTHFARRVATMADTCQITEGTNRLELCIANAVLGILDDDTSAQKATKLDAWLAAQKIAGTPVKIVYQLETPVRTPMTAVQVGAADTRLTVYKECTHIYGSGGVIPWMTAKVRGWESVQNAQSVGRAYRTTLEEAVWTAAKTIEILAKGVTASDELIGGVDGTKATAVQQLQGANALISVVALEGKLKFAYNAVKPTVDVPVVVYNIGMSPVVEV